MHNKILFFNCKGGLKQNVMHNVHVHIYNGLIIDTITFLFDG